VTHIHFFLALLFLSSSTLSTYGSGKNEECDKKKSALPQHPKKKPGKFHVRRNEKQDKEEAQLEAFLKTFQRTIGKRKPISPPSTASTNQTSHTEENEKTLFSVQIYGAPPAQDSFDSGLFSLLNGAPKETNSSKEKPHDTPAPKRQKTDALAELDLDALAAELTSNKL